MNLKDVELSTFDVARIVGVSAETVRYWCRHGYLKGKRLTKLRTKNWRVAGFDFVTFLYFNPKYRLKAQNSKHLSEIRDKVLSSLDKRPNRVYDIDELSDIFCISKEGVNYWVQTGKLRETRNSVCIKRVVFLDTDVEEFVKNEPYYAPIYQRYLERIEENGRKKEESSHAPIND